MFTTMNGFHSVLPSSCRARDGSCMQSARIRWQRRKIHMNAQNLELSLFLVRQLGSKSKTMCRAYSLIWRQLCMKNGAKAEFGIIYTMYVFKYLESGWILNYDFFDTTVVPSHRHNKSLQVDLSCLFTVKSSVPVMKFYGILLQLVLFLLQSGVVNLLYGTARYSWSQLDPSSRTLNRSSGNQARFFYHIR